MAVSDGGVPGDQPVWVDDGEEALGCAFAPVGEPGQGHGFVFVEDGLASAVHAAQGFFSESARGGGCAHAWL